MIRFTSFAIAAPLVCALSGVLGGSARAQSQADLAAKANEEGKELMYADKYAEAAKKFQEAVARVPEAKYFVNLCTARLQEGKLDEALTACNAVDLNNPTPDQKARAGKLIDKINEEAGKQHLDLHPGGGGGGNPNLNQPNNPNPNPNNPNNAPTYTPAVGRPLQTNLVTQGRPDNRYTWTLGFDAFGGGGRIGRTDYYGNVFGGFRLKGDYMLDQAHRVGGQFYIQYSDFNDGSNQTTAFGNLTVVDIGLAVFKHACLGSTPRLCITPLAGVHLSTMSPAGSMDSTGTKLFNYDAAGGRLEVATTLAFGGRFEHALSLIGGANLYSPVFSGDPAGDLPVSEVGLDKGGVTVYFGLGYTYRFNTPIGSSPFIILE